MNRRNFLKVTGMGTISTYLFADYAHADADGDQSDRFYLSLIKANDALVKPLLLRQNLNDKRSEFQYNEKRIRNIFSKKKLSWSITSA